MYVTRKSHSCFCANAISDTGPSSSSCRTTGTNDTQRTTYSTKLHRKIQATTIDVCAYFDAGVEAAAGVLDDVDRCIHQTLLNAQLEHLRVESLQTQLTLETRPPNGSDTADPRNTPTKQLRHS